MTGGLEGDINSSNNNNSVLVHSLREWGEHHLEDSRKGWEVWGDLHCRGDHPILGGGRALCRGEE